MATISGVLMVDGLPKNGATAKLYASSAFGSPPAKNTAAPASPLQTVTTGTTHGGDGAYRFTGVSAGLYYVALEFAGATIYDTHNVQADTAAPNVRQYGAVGDGVADDTAAFQAAVDDAAVGEILVPYGIYKCGNILISARNNLRIRGTGGEIRWNGAAAVNDQIGFQLGTTCSNIEFDGLRVTGSGTAADGHALVWAESGANLTDIRVLNCRGVNLTRGVVMDTPTALRGLLVQGCTFDTVVGTGSRQGEGVYVDDSTANATNVRIVANEFNNAQQYDIHVVRARDVVIANNTSRTHRSTGASGAVSPCIRLSRPQNVVIEGNAFYLYRDGAIEITPSAGVVAQNIIIRGNLFIDPQNAVTTLQIGTTSPGSTGTPQDVLVQGNQFYQTGRNVDVVTVNSCKQLAILGNQFRVLSVSSGTVGAVHLRGDGEGAGTATYSDGIQLAGNFLLGSTSGGTLVLFLLRSTFCTSGALVQFSGNRQQAATATFSSGASISNANVSVEDQAVDGLTLASGVRLLPETIQSGAQWVPIGGLTAAASPYTALLSDQVILCDTSGGAITVNLPALATCKGKVYQIRRMAGGSNVTIDGNGAETIDGAATKALTSNTAAVEIVAHETGWFIVSERA